MADIHKLQKDGNVIWPATTTNAVIDPDTKVVLQDSINRWNISDLWPDEPAQSIVSAVPVLAAHIPADKKIPGAKVEFKNAAGKNEAWEFIGGTGIAFTDIAGWKECGGNVISELLNEVFPITTTFTANPSVIPVGVGTEVTLTWSSTRMGNSITSSCDYTIDGNIVSGTSKKETITPSNYTTFTRKIKTTYRGDSKENTVNIIAVQPTYFGAISATATPTSETVGALPSRLQTTKAATMTGVSYSNQKYVYAYPAALGDLSSIKDGNGFEYLSGGGFTKTTITLNSVSYNVYCLTTQATVTNFKYIFS